jgi:thioredoxin reductase (NADPH)
MNKRSAEVAIVGAGPIGIELAVAMKRAGMDYLHFDAKQIGYTISWFAPQTRFFSSNERIAIAGIPLLTPDQGKCTREQYLAYLRGVVEQFDLRINTYEPVEKIERAGGGFALTTLCRGKEHRYEVGKLVLATGGTATPRKLNVRGEYLPHVSHYFGDPHQYFRRNLLIVGGKNSAVEAALRCHYAGARVTICHRKPEMDQGSIKYWLWPEIMGLMKARSINGCFDHRVVELFEDNAILESGAGKRQRIETDCVLLLIGYESDMRLCKMSGVELTGAGECPKHDRATMETNVPGVYVAGTAVAGTQQKYSLFIENCHEHVERIMASLQGREPPMEGKGFERPES